MGQHRRHRHHRHLNAGQFNREPVTHVYNGGYYLAPWDTGYMTAQQPHPADQCADPASCPAHAGDATAGMTGDATAGTTGDATGGAV